MIGGRHAKVPIGHDVVQLAESGDLSTIGGLSGAFLRGLGLLLRHPAQAFGVAVLCLLSAGAS